MPATGAPSVPTELRQPHLQRGLTTRAAIAVNIIDMVGVGPFVTLPLIVVAMGGPRAILGWILGAALSLCDGCIWSELGTAYPEAGGSYAYLKHLYGEQKLGRALSFLYAWQLLFSAPLSIASGCIGFSQYAAYLLPVSSRSFSLSLLHVPVVLSAQTALAIAICLLAALVLHLDIGRMNRLFQGLGLAVIAILIAIIFIGFTHFHPAMAFDFPPGSFRLDPAFFAGLGVGLLISSYDYWGYYNVCFLGSEVRDPQRTIPRAVLGSIVIVGTLYTLMNISILGVVPWREFTNPATSSSAFDLHRVALAIFMQRAFPGALGQHAAVIVAALISFAAAASVLALLLGYSRIPYAAALDGNFPAFFSKLDPKRNVPYASLRVLTAATVFCCLFRLQEVITTLVVIRILFQFLLQGVAVLLPAHRRMRKAGVFRMPLYPLPVLLALSGFVFILVSRPHFLREMRTASVILLAGAIVYLLRLTRARVAPPRA
jgi:amino acid transporter